MTPAHDAHAQAAATWTKGDYPRLAERLAPAAQTAADLVGVGRGRRAIDVAAGTGSLALALAGLDWEVEAVDISPTLVAEGRRRSAEAGLDITWHEGPLDELPAADGTLDLVASSFGMIFAPDPEVALQEAHRTLGPSGALLLTTWPHDGYLASMTDVMAMLMPPGAPVSAPFRWGDVDQLRAWLRPWFAHVDVTTHRLPWRFDDVDTAVGFLFEASPGHVAAESLVGDRAVELRAAVGEHLAGHAGGTGPVDLEIEYLVTHARARG